MDMRLVRTSILAGALLMAGAAAGQAPTTPAEPMPAVLASLQPGLWHVRMLEGSADPGRDICVGDARLLVQLRHGPATCSRFVAADEPKVATVTYTCPGTGSGRTSLRLSESGLLRIDSQGIADKAPFAFVAEARRTGECPAGHMPDKPAAALPGR
jgi:hypothetical protein